MDRIDIVGVVGLVVNDRRARNTMDRIGLHDSDTRLGP